MKERKLKADLIKDMIGYFNMRPALLVACSRTQSISANDAGLVLYKREDQTV